MFKAGGADRPEVGSTIVVGCLKNSGFNDCVVFNPSYRHHSKCASINRCWEREAVCITVYEAKVETIMMASSQSMQEGTKTRHERDVVLAEQLVQFEKRSCKQSEGQVGCQIEPNFGDR